MRSDPIDWVQNSKTTQRKFIAMKKYTHFIWVIQCQFQLISGLLLQQLFSRFADDTFWATLRISLSLSFSSLTYLLFDFCKIVIRWKCIFILWFSGVEHMLKVEIKISIDRDRKFDIEKSSLTCVQQVRILFIHKDLITVDEASRKILSMICALKFTVNPFDKVVDIYLQ